MTFYETQGTLPSNAPSYVERRADQELYEGLLRGEFCYVLTSRQMGKSSLMVRTAQKLREDGCRVVLLDLTAIGVNLTAEQWYDGLLVKIGRQLHLESQLEDFWLDHERIGPVQRLFMLLREVVLPHLDRFPGPPAGDPSASSPDGGSRLVIFIDEIDTVRGLPFVTDEFFAAIREWYNARVAEPAFNLLTFGLLGVALPSDLIRDLSATPFNIGRRIELTDFTPAEAASLVRGLPRPAQTAQKLLQRVLEWTHGHPYLTQRLCQALAAEPQLNQPTDVDQLCGDLFLSSRAREQDDNLLFVRESLRRAGMNRLGLLQLYEQVRGRGTVPNDEANPLINRLRLCGITRVERGLLAVRNRIYAHVFDENWIRANLQTSGGSEAKSVAVLPFIDSSVENSEYLSDGLTDELINALGQVPGLRVASRTSTFQFKGRTGDARNIGAKLGVAIVVEGSVRKLGSRVRVAAELVSVLDGHRIWSGSYKHSVEDLHEISQEIAKAVVERLKSEFGQAPPSMPVLRPRTHNLEAYNLYLKGCYYWNKRTEPAIKRSQGFFEAALDKDPQYAAAYAGLADAYILLGIYSCRPPSEAYPKAREAAIRALDLDDHLAQAHCALGCTSAVYDWDWVRAEKAFKRAIQLNPSYATAHQWYAINCLSPLGRHDEALAELRLAQEVDPLSISIPASVGLALHLAGRHDEAIAQCRLTVELDETFWLTHLFLGWACQQKSMFPEAVAAFQTSIELSQGDPAALAALGHAYAAQGLTVEATRLLERLLVLSQTRYVPASEIALVYLGLGDRAKAQQWIETAHRERSLRLIYFAVDPRLAELRSEPGIPALSTMGKT